MASILPLTSRPGLPRIVPFTTYILFIAVHSWLTANESHAPTWDIRWLYGVKVALVAIAIGYFWRSYEELRFPTSLTAVDWLISIALGILIFVLWINLDQSWLTLGTAKGFNATRANGDIDIPLAVTRWIGAALIVPVMEELFWRSFMLRWLQCPDFMSLKPSKVTLKISLVTAVMFGIEHNLWFAGILAGFAYNWLYIRTGKLWTPIVAHAITNGMLGVWVVTTGNWQFW